MHRQSTRPAPNSRLANCHPHTAPSSPARVSLYFRSFRPSTHAVAANESLLVIGSRDSHVTSRCNQSQAFKKRWTRAPSDTRPRSLSLRRGANLRRSPIRPRRGSHGTAWGRGSAMTHFQPATSGGGCGPWPTGRGLWMSCESTPPIGVGLSNSHWLRDNNNVVCSQWMLWNWVRRFLCYHAAWVTLYASPSYCNR